MRLLRCIALYFGHLLVAVIGTAMITTSLGKMFHPKSLAGIISKEWVLSILCATVIGLLMYRTWRWRPAVWVWIVPAVWLAFGVLMLLPSAYSHSVLVSGSGLWYQLSGSDCAHRVSQFGCRNFFLFTVPFIRSVAYSFGTLVGIRIWHNKDRSKMEVKAVAF
jgi:hypothetical protein